VLLAPAKISFAETLPVAYLAAAHDTSLALVASLTGRLRSKQRSGRRHCASNSNGPMIHQESSGFSFSPKLMISQFKYNADGLIPAIVQDAATKRVLMMAWMNEQSIRMTLEKGLMVYFSRSRQKYWVKGETSGNVQKVKRWCVDCDKDTLLFEVDQTGGACHTGYESCFFQELDSAGLPKPIDEQPLFDAAKTYGR
jgi:phosphoribosyl-AMP cyclohydrolase